MEKPEGRLDVSLEYPLLYKWFQGYVISKRELPSYGEMREEITRLGIRPCGGLKQLRSRMARQMVQDTREVAERVLGMKLSERKAQAMLGFSLD